MATATHENELLLSPKRQSIQLLSKIMPNVTEDVIQGLLPIIFDTISKKIVLPGALDNLRQKVQPETVDRLFGGLFTLIQILLRQKPETIKEANLRQMLKSLKFNEESSSYFIYAFFESKSCLSGASLFQYYPQMKQMDWRVDITLSSSALNKSIKTVIIMHFQLSSGEHRSFEISIVKFHMLRLYVATMLREFHIKEKQ